MLKLISLILQGRKKFLSVKGLHAKKDYTHMSEQIYYCLSEIGTMLTTPIQIDLFDWSPFAVCESIERDITLNSPVILVYFFVWNGGGIWTAMQKYRINVNILQEQQHVTPTLEWS